MTVLLTLVVALLVVAIVSLVTWEIVHRRSALVRLWHPSTFPGRVGGGLGMLAGGTVSDRLTDDEPETIVLLHGLGATGDYFGDLYEGLGNTHQLVMPDLLGFGRSLDERRHTFSLVDHVDAIDGALGSLGRGSEKVFLAAHSMGAAIALEWARRHPDRVTGVALWGPPIYDTDAMSDDVAHRLADPAGGMTRLLLADDQLAERMCRFSCANRDVSGWLMASAAPRWPVDVSRRAALHTWEAFDGSIHSLVLDVDWATLFDLDVPVTIFRGLEDPIGDRGYTDTVARSATIVEIEGAGHHVPITHSHLLFDLLEAGPTTRS